MTITEAAERAGVNRTTLARAMRDGSVPVPLLKIGKSVRVPRQKFEQWIAGGNPAPAGEGSVAGSAPGPLPPSSS